MNNLKKQFGKRIKELREKRCLSQEQLAEMVNMESRHISRIETGNSFTTIENINNIAIALGVTVSNIFEYEHKKEHVELKKELIDIIKNLNEDKIELAYKIIKNINF